MPHRRKDRPIESVELKITFKADRATAEAIRKTIPSATARSGACVVRIEGEQPGEVADKAREVLEKIRKLTEPSKGFN